MGLSSGKRSLNSELLKAFSEAIINLYFGSGGDDHKNATVGSLRTLADHRFFCLNKEKPPWIDGGQDSIKYSYRKVSHKVLTSFDQKYGNFYIHGSMLSNILELKVGMPDEYDQFLVNRRVINSSKRKYENMDPHPIP